MELLKNLENPNILDEQKAKIIIEISEAFDTIITTDGNATLIECYLNAFINYLSKTPCQFQSESPSQKVCQKVNNFVYVCNFIFNTFLDSKNNFGNDTQASSF